jgi:GxGYxYP putative glycoside hydrolase C-terminal domain/GxGYxYP_N 1st domain
METWNDARDTAMKTRRNFLKTGLFVGAGLPIAANLEQVFAATSETSENSVRAQTVPPPDVVFTYDARPLQKLDLRQLANAQKIWDILHVLAALQGLANRTAPRFYLFYCAEFGTDTDQFWFDWFRGEDGWLKNTQARPLTNVAEAVTTFRDAFDGLVVYDPNVPATSNLASTAAGVERLLPVRFDTTANSLFTLLTQKLNLPVKLWLVNPDATSKFTGRGTLPDFHTPSSGSPKVDAYRWAAARWLKSGRCAPGVAAYYIDAFWLRHPTNASPDMHTLSNHDWFIARRGFFFDLSPWGDEPPVDDPMQPPGADKHCLLAILRDLYDHADGGIIKLGGFPPWPYKYTTFGGAGKHEGVPTEWEFIRLTSQFNVYAEADAAGLGAMANASFFQHYPLKARYWQPNSKPALAQWRSRGLVTADGRIAKKFFVGHYVGDYDSPSWLYKAVPAFFRDPARGTVPLGWAFDPNLADRAPQALVYAYQRATPNDFFIAGDSGAGYLNPRGLTFRPDSALPSGLAAWREFCRRWFERWGMTITGFLLDGSSGATTEAEFAAYRAFSPDGIGGVQSEKNPAMRAGVPICPELDLPGDAEQAANVISSRAVEMRRQTGFLWVRGVLRSPAWYAEVSRRLREQHPEASVEIVDPYTFFGLICRFVRK